MFARTLFSQSLSLADPDHQRQPPPGLRAQRGHHRRAQTRRPRSFTQRPLRPRVRPAGTIPGKFETRTVILLSRSIAQPIVKIVIPLSRAVGFPRSNSQSNLRNALPSEFDFTDENSLLLSDPGSQGPLPVGQLLPLPLRPPVDLRIGVPRRRRPPGQRPHHVPPGKPGRRGLINDTPAKDLIFDGSFQICISDLEIESILFRLSNRSRGAVRAKARRKRPPSPWFAPSAASAASASPTSCRSSRSSRSR